MAYYASSGPAQGSYLWKDAAAAIFVVRAPDKLMPIGVAMPIGPDGDGVTIWRLTIRDVEVSGLWVVIDREFKPVQ